MTTKTKTKIPAALGQAGKDFTSSKAAVYKNRTTLDKAVKSAAKSGVTYRDIAKEIGLSVAWVQLSLTRSGVTSPR